MAPLPPGQKFAVLDPTLYWAPLNTKLPQMKLKYGTAWPSPWTRIMDTLSGVAVTNRNPRVPIVSEERNRIGSVRGGGGGAGARGGGSGGGRAGQGGGGAGTSIGFRALTFSDDFWKFANGMSKVIVAAQTEVFDVTITGATAGAGQNATVRLGNYDGTYNDYTVPIAAADTPAAAATKMANPANYVPVGAAPAISTLFTLSNPSAGVVRFTAVTSGPLGAHAFGFSGTGLVASAPAYSVVGTAAYNSAYVDEDKEFHIMVGFEGFARAGSLFTEDRLVRGIAYEVENTQNGVDAWARTNADAVLSANVVLEALPTIVDPVAHLAGTGISLASIGPDQRFTYFDTIRV